MTIKRKYLAPIPIQARPIQHSCIARMEIVSYKQSYHRDIVPACQQTESRKKEKYFQKHLEIKRHPLPLSLLIPSTYRSIPDKTKSFKHKN